MKLLLTLTLLSLICPGLFDCRPPRYIVTTGIASQYAPGVMTRVIQYRISHGQIRENLTRYDGFVAVPECDDIGKVLWIRPIGNEELERFLAVDCGSKSDSRWQDKLSGYEWMIQNGILVELDYQTAVRWGTVGRAIEVEVRE